MGENLKMIDVSLIVPMYNVEKTLPRCVESILKQTHKNIEIILVDDESPDKCGEMAENYAKQDKRVKVIHQKNKWLGGARNSGLRIATGKYVCFVDSDDYLRLDMCEKLLSCLEQKPADVVAFDFYSVSKDGEIKDSNRLPIIPDKLYEGRKVQDLLYPIIISSHIMNGACMKIYNRNFLIDNNLFFDETVRYAEDYVFCLELFPKITSFVYYNKPCYYYAENSESIMHSIDPHLVDKFVILYNYREDFLKRENISTKQNRKSSAELLVSMIVKTLNRYLGRPKIGIKKEKLQRIKYMCENPVIRSSITKINIDDMGLGRYGKMIIWGIKHKAVRFIYALYLIGER